MMTLRKEPRGTFGYTAPEIDYFKPHIITYSVDMWSFAVVMVYIVNNGKNVFHKRCSINLELELNDFQKMD